ncbi:MAG: hypothetical protein K0S71_2356 [Clostridia bacterium]|jgi:uncharacterized membrane protein YvlD (DUF360 family)|nr:hypothetical protein [Clostridia bacterium]
MEVTENINQKNMSIQKPKGMVGKIIVCVVLALIPIILSGIMTFFSLPLRGLYVFVIGTFIGLLTIPFMLYITKVESWTKKWYIWIGIIITIMLVIILPMFKNTGMSQMQDPMQNGQMQGNIMMEKGMY